MLMRKKTKENEQNLEEWNLVRRGLEAKCQLVQISYNKQIELLYSWHFSRYSVPIHWLIHGHMTFNNETVSRQLPWVGNIAKTMTSNGKQFTVTGEMLTAVARDGWNLSAVLLLFCFAIQYRSNVSWQSRLETRFSILEVFENRESSFEFRFSRFESQVSRIEFRVSRHSKNFSRISNRDFEETI